MANNPVRLDDNLHWYKDAIIYELHIKAFRDGDGDGMGDFSGLLEKLDYLKELGITAIWILPFYPSPLKDDGYDIADYYDINPSYGDLKSFRRVIREAHKRDLKVITELVINHTSDQHPWFQRARLAPKDSTYRNYYVWSDDPTRYKDVRIIFQDFEASNWTWDPVAKQYYWHRFFHHQPDLNYDNPQVQEEVFKMIDYWCNMGVDGFRLDAVPYLFERENTNGENLPETHAYLKKLRKHVDAHFPGKVFLAEANMWPEDSASYFGNGDECHMNYHFPVMPRMFMSLQMEDRYPITDIFDQTPEIPETCQWAIFLRNHDELTLEMVTDEERDYMYKVYAKDPKAKINLGIRHRLAPLMENNRRKIELMNVLLFSLRGTPVIYYGDEIGMGDNFYLGDRDGVRTPMQWSAARNAGFSEANPQQLYLPLILDPEYHFESINVEAQRKNPSSLLWFMKMLIQTRKQYKAFGRGDMKFIDLENPKVLAFTRTYEDETLLVVVNFSRYAQAAELDLDEYKGYVPFEIVSNNRFPEIRDGHRHTITLGPHGYFWFRLEKTEAHVSIQYDLYHLTIKDWDSVVDANKLDELSQNVIPDYILKTNWFRGRDRRIRNLSISQFFSLHTPDNNVFILLIDIMYETGTADTYQLHIAFMANPGADQFAEAHPLAAICRMTVGDKKGMLLDALHIPDYQKEIFHKLARNQHHTLKTQELVFHGDDTIRKYLHADPPLRSKVLPVDDRNTSVGYDKKFFLKIYRHVDRTINPDIEITRFLTEQTDFRQVPSFFGSIDWKQKKDTITLGMMQELVAYHGDGRSYLLERLNNFQERIMARESHPPLDLLGTLENPVPFEMWPEDVKEFIGGTVAEGMYILGTRTAEMHLALASRTDIKDFAPEEFSLHYQRSIFSGLQTLVRASFESSQKNLHLFPEELQLEVQRLNGRRTGLQTYLKKIYAKKMDVFRIRIHGNYGLKKVLFTGKDIAILDFHGDPTRSYTARRIKRSPLQDVAGMIRSFNYVAHEHFFMNSALSPEEKEKMIPFMNFWIHHVSSLFMESYLNAVKGTALIPRQTEDLRTMLETYIMSKALYSYYYEVNKRPDWVMVPLRMIKGVLDRTTV